MASSPHISLPTIPSSIEPELKDYLTALTKVITSKQIDDYSENKEMIKSGSNNNGKYIKYRNR